MRTEKEILTEIEQTKTLLKKLQLELDAVKLAKSKENANSYEKRKKLLEEASAIFAKILKPGDYVKVTGSRAGSYREVKEISKYTLIGATCTFNTRVGKITQVHSYDIITCGTNKIIAVLRDGKWITAKEIVSQETCTH
jgi:hypothetical protein